MQSLRSLQSLLFTVKEKLLQLSPSPIEYLRGRAQHSFKLERPVRKQITIIAPLLEICNIKTFMLERYPEVKRE